MSSHRTMSRTEEVTGLPRPGPDVVVAGVSCVDCVVRSKTFEAGVMNPAQIRVCAGGIGNAVVALSGLGMSLGVSTRVGRDMFGDYLTRRWRDLGADTAGVVVDDALPTGLSMVLNHLEERTPFYAEGAVAAFGLSDVPRKYVEASKAMLIFFAGALPALDGPPMLELVRACHQNGCAVLLDLSDKLGADYSPVIDCLPYVNLVTNSVEAERMTGRKDPAAAVERLYQMAGGCLGNRCLAVTRSGGVTLLQERNGSPVVTTLDSPFYGRPVNDVVGAGDAFRAGLAWHISQHHGLWRDGRLDWNRAFLQACAVSYLFLSRTTDERPFSAADVERIINETTTK